MCVCVYVCVGTFMSKFTSKCMLVCMFEHRCVIDVIVRVRLHV
jgi:hypothetical protein